MRISPRVPRPGLARCPADVVLGGRKVAVPRPRVRADGHEVPLPTFQALAHTDPLNRRVVEHRLVGVATRQYARSLEPLPGRRGEPRHEQKQRQPTVRGEDHGAASDMAICTVGRPRPCGVAPRRRAHRGALPRGGPRDRGGMAKNTRWACGRARPRTRPYVRAYWRISRAVGCARTAASW